MEHADRELTPLDELYLQRACELAARGIGSTAPNPPVGAVVVRDGRIVGEGYHHRAGDSHAETNALVQAGAAARGATIYVSLEPCRHAGRTPPCTHALARAGIVRVVAGTVDPTEHGGGAAELRRQGIETTIAGDPGARRLIEVFAQATRVTRPYVALKMAMSLDGAVASRAGTRERLGSAEEERYVRELRTQYDAVMVGAGTIRVDDPLLTVRPPHDRERPFVRVVACESGPISPRSRVFAAAAGYAPTVVLVPAGLRDRFAELDGAAELLAVGEPSATALDLRQAMKDLRAYGLVSVLCEGGPKLGASLLAAKAVDRVFWAIAPRFLNGEDAVRVLSGADLREVRFRFDRIERAGADVILSGPTQENDDV